MFKTTVFCVALVGSFGATMAIGQARQVLVWGQYYTVDDDPVVVRAPPSFNAVTAHPERYDHDRRHQIELDPAQ